MEDTSQYPGHDLLKIMFAILKLSRMLYEKHMMFVQRQ